MGSSTRKKTSRQPRRLAPAELGSAGGEWDETLDSDVLSVPLVRIRVNVLRRTVEGERVRIVEDTAGLLVWVSRGVLGEIPPHYERAVRQGPYVTGRLTKLRLEPPSAVVSLSR